MATAITPTAPEIKIETIDLASPPPFVRVAETVAQLSEVTTCEDPRVSSWLYTPDWGDLAAIFDRKATIASIHGVHCDLGGAQRSSAGIKSCTNNKHSRQAAELLNDPLAMPFLDRCALLEGVFLANLDGMHSSTRTMRFNSSFNRNSGIHTDPIQVRATLATEIGQTVLVDDMDATLVRGRKWSTLEQAVDRGHQLYAAPFGTFTFLRGSHLAGTLERQLGRGTAHAVHPNPPGLGYSRPFMTMDYVKG